VVICNNHKTPTSKTQRISSKMQYADPQSTLEDLKCSKPCELHNFCS